MSGTITHSWNGTVLTVTSDSGTSSADLKGEKGDTGIRGPQGLAGTGGGADIDTSLFYTKDNPPTAAEVGARSDTWMPTAAQVGARSNTWMPSAKDVGARENTWMPTAAEVGARSNTWMPTAKEVGARSNTWMPTAKEVGAAPSGYGLGDTSDMKTIDNISLANTNGWFKYEKSYKGITNWVIRADTDGTNIFQEMKAIHKGDPIIANRTFTDGAWTLEWENPALGYNNEYRTTERYGNKPVYTMLVNVGAFTNGNSTIIPVDAPCECIRYSATASGNVLPLFLNTGVHAAVNVSSIDEGIEVIMTGANNSVIDGKDVKIQVWYIKN